ncbi:MAG: hypothetical protein Kow0027_22920 [Saprospiraceae bacterium]|jgi:uncharacterized integral membrane protein|nr:hypothetical protein [Saprospirales bacterium]RME01628.1 MAG: hypothetical protein D6816_12080 [Bacteroidota bacterium]
MKKAAWLTVGFLLFFIGFLSIILNMVGVEFSFLTWLDRISGLVAFIVKILMIIGGIVILYLNSTNWREEEAEL